MPTRPQRPELINSRRVWMFVSVCVCACLCTMYTCTQECGHLCVCARSTRPYSAPIQAQINSPQKGSKGPSPSLCPLPVCSPCSRALKRQAPFLRPASACDGSVDEEGDAMSTLHHREGKAGRQDEVEYLSTHLAATMIGCMQASRCYVT